MNTEVRRSLIGPTSSGPVLWSYCDSDCPLEINVISSLKL